MMYLPELLKKTDDEWYRELFESLSPNILKNIDVTNVIEQSIKSAEKVYEKFEDAYEEEKLLAYIKSYGVTIRYVDKSINSPNIALYDDNEKKLVIFTSTVEKLYQQLLEKGMGELINKKLFNQLILSHEFYHIVEMNEEDIYTYSKIIERKYFGFLKIKEQLPIASEIGSYHFSKILNKLWFSPRIIELVPLIKLNKQTDSEL